MAIRPLTTNSISSPGWAALLDPGIDIPAFCCGGICGSCKVDWLEGAPVHRDRVLSAAERQRSLMVCVAGSAKDRLVLDL
jgi:vanillate O-demethylase ferredoxin subunit